MMTRVREELQVEMPLRLLFEAPTLAEFAQSVIAHESRAGQTERIAKVWLRIQEMSVQEAQDTLDHRSKD
jgi:hypothetical protein